MEATLLLALYPEALQRGVLGNLTAVVLHRRQDGIVKCLLDIVHIVGIVGQTQQALVDLHPGKSHAGLHAV